MGKSIPNGSSHRQKRIPELFPPNGLSFAEGSVAGGCGFEEKYRAATNLRKGQNLSK